MLYNLSIRLITYAIFLTHCSIYAIDWYEEYNTKWTNGINPSYTLPWSETYTVRSYISMYRASKARGEPLQEQQKWLDRLIEHFNYIKNSSAMETEGKSNFVYAGHGFTPLADFIRIIFGDKKLYSQYKDLANAYLYYLETRIIPYWRNQPDEMQWEYTPFNWYLSYGTLLINLHQISGSPHYLPPDYITPDTTLKDYYLKTISDMSLNYFQDFGEWSYTQKNWQWDFTSYPKTGLCYVSPPIDSYIWRYLDYSDYLIFSGNNQVIEMRKSVHSNEWYRIVITYENNSLNIKWFDSTGVKLIYENTSPWILKPTNSDMYIGRRLDSPTSAYLGGTLDEIRITKEDKTVAYWQFDGNAYDSSGNNHNGTIIGNPEWVDGKFGQALKFDYDYVQVPHSPDLDDFTKIELWIKFSECTPKYYNYILGKGYGFPDTTGYHLYLTSYKRPEDVGHANLDIEFLLKAAHDPIFSSAYPVDVIKRFCNTFTKIVWSNSDTSFPEFKSHLHPDRAYGDTNSSTHTLRWLWLYEFEPLVGTLISNWYENHPSDWLSEAVANLACWQSGLRIDDYETTNIDDEIVNNESVLRLFPNPVQDYLRIIFPNNIAHNFSLEIFNCNGISVFKNNIINSSKINSLQINTGLYPSGVYYIVLKSASKIEKAKFIILK